MHQRPRSTRKAKTKTYSLTRECGAPGLSQLFCAINQLGTAIYKG